MDHWPFTVRPTTKAEIELYCPAEEWQKVRLSMKGTSTEEKLKTLFIYRAACMKASGGVLERCHRVQIDNYINALKRGGQLSITLMVSK